MFWGDVAVPTLGKDLGAQHGAHPMHFTGVCIDAGVGGEGSYSWAFCLDHAFAPAHPGVPTGSEGGRPEGQVVPHSIIYGDLGGTVREAKPG